MHVHIYCLCICMHIFMTYSCYYSLANEVAKGYSNATVCPSFLPSVHPSFHSILVNTLGSGESGALLIFKVKGHQVKFLPQHPCGH